MKTMRKCILNWCKSAIGKHPITSILSQNVFPLKTLNSYIQYGKTRFWYLENDHEKIITAKEECWILLTS